MLLFSVLGSIEIMKQRVAVRLGGAMQQTLLATLLAAGGSLVTVDSLILELWGTTPPNKVENALQAQVSRVRRTLAAVEPDREGSRVVTSTSGYMFLFDRWELDAYLFLDTVDAIHARTGTDTLSEHRQNVADLRAGLSRWRGPVFGGLAGGPICRTASTRYMEARNSALILLYDLELRTGGHERILPELTELYSRNPNHEQFCMLLMRALYRCGRQLDALTVYRQCRHNMIESQGIEPSPVLSQYERAILTHDPMLLQNEPYWPVPALVAS
ncbi:Transcriptional regulatory protein MoaR1 (plasmid) [Streptomyces lavendulae subsp. lavendulae]|uniref:Regulatory protein n=3 Tax=Streptomycetaceae TaxID=2062 RepID=A0A068L7X7_KITAU|nr:regulatory protein [Streptomyces lavendulae subsp. lavendulae]ATZ29711.1 Transcriptional regulatory protein MoaR1 [Streptomyces lavendulae subsp. lavendulae]MDH6542185.1 DNA-binding SARP family transcriptional activator [Streptomyces sp. SPB4]